jgi:hypothetical protein
MRPAFVDCGGIARMLFARTAFGLNRLDQSCPDECYQHSSGFSFHATIVRTKVGKVKDFLLLFLAFVRTVLGMEARMGRPPKSGDKPMGERLEIRIEAHEKATYDKAAEASGMDRSDWIRHTLNAAAKRALRANRSAH